MTRRATFFLAAALAGAVGCAPRTERLPRPGPDEFSVMTYNVMRYCFDDRDGDGQAAEPKPEREVEALVGVIQAASPDVLAIQEMGTRAQFDEFCGRLNRAGLGYRHFEWLPSPATSVNLAVASRLPLVGRLAITNERYRAGGGEAPVQRGFLAVDVEPAAGYRFRLYVAHLKSKRFHELGQTEMRRNEARLLNKRVRQDLAANSNLNILVVGDMNDTVRSDAIRELVGADPPALHDLRPADAAGEVWTHEYRYQDSYERIDYLLVSAGMRPEWVPEKSAVVRDARAAAASDHRPVLAVFRARDLAPLPSAATHRPAAGAGAPAPD